MTEISEVGGGELYLAAVGMMWCTVTWNQQQWCAVYAMAYGMIIPTP